MNTDSENIQTSPTGNRLAGLLRWAGIGTFALSAIVFLLQGIESVDGLLRNWTYLIMMVAVGALGIGVHRWLKDDKSARLLLGAGVALIPVQFAQLAGRVHDLFGTHASQWLSSSAALDTSMLLIGALCSVVLALPVAFAGFRVLARDKAGIATIALLGSAAMLIFPWREGLLATSALLVMAGMLIVADRKFTTNNPISRTMEGRSVRLLMTLPLVIAAARMVFYIDSLHGLVAVGGLIGAGLVAASRIYFKPGAGREFMLFSGASVAALSGLLFTLLVADVSHAMQAALIAVSVGLMGVGQLSRNGSAYRGFAAVLFFLSTSYVVFTATGALLLMFMLGLALLILSYACKWREPAVAGAATLLIAACKMAGLAVAQVDLGSWIGLAVVGIMLVLAAAVLERHGKRLFALTSAGWQQVRSW